LSVTFFLKEKKKKGKKKITNFFFGKKPKLLKIRGLHQANHFYLNISLLAKGEKF
jgi:hypothetical protein